jgi:hypothetical protein
MTREPLEYPGDPYNDPDYDEVAILKAEIARLTRLLDAFHDGGAAAEIERLKAEKTEMADAILQIGGLSEVYFRTLVSFEIAEFIFTERTAALEPKP